MYIKMNTEELFDIAISHYNAIDFENVEVKHKNIIIGGKYIAEVNNHDFIPTPCIEIKLDLQSSNTNRIIGHYSLYITNNKEFLDEFLVLI